ncbi:ANK_REP_REGION domain-containing protein, partial [Haematococcus lacustris]
MQTKAPGPGVPGEAGSAVEPAVLAAAVAYSKLGLVEQLVTSLRQHPGLLHCRDGEGRSCLHYAAGYGSEEVVDMLLAKAADARCGDVNGDLPLHFAAIHGHAMCAYNLAKASTGSCLERNQRGQSAIDVAVACARGEVLNAMLLACAGDNSSVAVGAMQRLLRNGAVPDTWAPNGSSALMLAASVDSTTALQVLLDAGATLELQDALGRTALMFAAGNSAVGALRTLLGAGACIAQRDRRG